MSKKRVLILGAGLAGLSAAWHLQKKGIDCQTFEKESEVGGLCRSKKIGGFVFDYDGHLLHFRHHYTFKLVKSLLKDNLIEHQRSSWIYSYGRYTCYPFQAKLHGLAPSVIKECLLGLFEISKNGYPKNKKNLSFLDWINFTFGKGIAKHFMIPYNTKFWTLPPQKMTCEWLDGFIPVPSLNQIIEGTVEDNKRQFGYNVRFWYPKRGGIASLPLALANQIKNIYTNAQIVKIDLEEKKITMASGYKERFDYLISTVPLPEMSNLVKGLPRHVYSLFKELRWNSIFNFNLGVDRKDESSRHWIYFPQRTICFFRVGFPHNFSPYVVPSTKSSLYVEASYSKDKPINRADIILRIMEDLKKVDILTEKDRVCIQDINDIKYGYPIYDVNYAKTRKEIIKHLIHRNVIPCGRYGSWRYSSMEDTIIDGKKTASLFSKNV